MTRKQLAAIRDLESQAFVNGLERDEVAQFVDATIQDLSYRLFGGVRVCTPDELTSRYHVAVGYDMSRSQYIHATTAQDAMEYAETVWMGLNTTDNSCKGATVELFNYSGTCLKRWEAVHPVKTAGPRKKTAR